MKNKKSLRILASVYDKTGLDEFVDTLGQLYELEIVSSGGTAKFLKEAGFEVQTVESVTGFPEILGGRVKTLHPKIHGGLLADQNNPEHMSELEKLEISPFNMVIVNLYPFEETIATPDVTLDEAIEQIDIGGVALLRAAAKNFKSIIVVSDHEDYEKIAREMKESSELPGNHRRELAVKAFQHTSRYDKAISEYLTAFSTNPTVQDL